MYRRIVWHYGEQDTPVDEAGPPIARTSWANDNHPIERLASAGFEGVGRWHAGEPLEDAPGLAPDSGYYGSVLEVEYLDARSPQRGQVAAFTVEERDTDPDDDEDLD